MKGVSGRWYLPPPVMRGDCMKITKQDIVDTSIDLFAKHGVQNVSIEQIANTVKIAKSSIYHRFKGGKDDIVDNIIMIFDEMVQYNTPNKAECLDINSDARSVLFKLFFVIKGKESQKYRKINRILFSDQHYNDRIKSYMLEDIFKKREKNLIYCFNLLVQHEKVEPFNAIAAARILNHLYIAYAMEDSHNNEFNPNELPVILTNLQNDCMRIVQQIINGNFPD